MTRRTCEVEGCNNVIPAKYRPRRLSCSDECAGILRIAYKRKRRANAKLIPNIVSEPSFFDQAEAYFIYKREPIDWKEPLQPMYLRTYQYYQKGYTLADIASMEHIAETSVKSRLKYIKNHGYEVMS